MGCWRVRLRPHSQRGAVLLLTVWTAATLTGVVVLQAMRVSLQLRWAERTAEARQARHLAFAGIQALASRLSFDNPSFDSLKEPWAHFPDEAIPWRAGTFRWTVSDEQSTIPINAAPVSVLNRLPGFSATAAEELERRRTAGTLLVHLEELRTLPGFNSGSLEDLIPLATVHGVGPVNLNTAPQPVLAALGFSPGLGQQIGQFRTGADGLLGNEDDGTFLQPTAEGVETALRGFFGAGFALSPEDRATFALLAEQSPPMLGVTSSLFHVEAHGESARHGIRKKVIAVLERSGTIRGWNES